MRPPRQSGPPFSRAVRCAWAFAGTPTCQAIPRQPTPKSKWLSCLVLLLALPLVRAAAAPLRSLTREQVIAQTMKPYTGPTGKGVDRSTLTGKVMSGYQGWFAAEGDGCGRGWYHWNGRNGDV